MDDALNTGYPDVPQSLGITLKIIFSMLLFSPIMLLKTQPAVVGRTWPVNDVKSVYKQLTAKSTKPLMRCME